MFQVGTELALLDVCDYFCVSWGIKNPIFIKKNKNQNKT